MTDRLPKVLIIDDMLAADPEQRDKICDCFALFDAERMTPTSGETYLAEVTFERGQKLDGGKICNDIERVGDAISSGWPFDDGSYWSLILVDLNFTISSPTGPCSVRFGEEILQEMVRRWPREERGNFDDSATLLPVFMLSTADEEEVDESAKGIAVPIPKFAGPVDTERRKFAELLFSDGLVPDGALRIFTSDGRISKVLREKRIVGESRLLLEALRAARKQMLSGDLRVVVLAEQGTGKELLASYCHDYTLAATSYQPHSSRQKNGKLVTVHLASLPTELRTTALTGHEKGAFTGASGRQVGALEDARGGTLHLDEIGNLSTGDWYALMRHAEQKEFTRVGDGAVPIPIKCQIICSTNKDLESWAKEEKFPPDLLARFQQLYLPNLALRGGGEIKLLFDQFVRIEVRRTGCRDKKIDAAVYSFLESYRWPGNIRQLESVAANVVRARPAALRIRVEDVKHVVLKAGGMTRREEVKSFDELLAAMRSYRFASDDLERAWPKLKVAMGAVVENMLAAAVSVQNGGLSQRQRIVTGIGRTLGIVEETKTGEEANRIRAWLRWTQKYLGVRGEAVDRLAGSESRKKAKK